MPSLVDIRKLSYQDTLLCVLLRKKLLQNDRDGSVKVTIKLQELFDTMRLYASERSNEAAEQARIERAINNLLRYRFLHKLTEDEFEISRVLKARIGAEELGEIEARLKASANNSN